MASDKREDIQQLYAQYKKCDYCFYSWLHNTDDWKSVSFNYYHNELTDMLCARLKTDLPGPEVVRALEQCTDLRSIADEIHKKRIANSAMEKLTCNMWITE